MAGTTRRRPHAQAQLQARPGRLTLLLALIALLGPVRAAPSTAASVAVGITTSHPHSHVPPTFASFNIDNAALHSSTNLSDPHLLAAVRAWTSAAPSHMRIGGTFADYVAFGDTVPCPFPNGTRCTILTTERWRAILGFAHSTNASLVFNLNDLFGRRPKGKPEKPEPSGLPWNSTNARALLEWTKANVDKALWPYAFELGNELNDMLTGTQQAKDFQRLSDLIDDVFGADEAARPGLVGPDPHSATEFEDKGVAWLKAFAKQMGSQPAASRLRAFTYHMYILGSGADLHDDSKFFDPSELDRSGEGARTVAAAIAAGLPGVEVWAGETAAANNGGRSGLTNRFVDGFWYLDQLGTLASLGQSFQRQSLLGTSYGLLNVSAAMAPQPDYFVALAWKTLMGEHSLETHSASRLVRAYTHCHPSLDGSITLAVINLDKGGGGITVAPNVTAASADAYVLSAGHDGDLHSPVILLNGAPLAFDGLAPPAITGQPVADPSGGFAFPAGTFGFVHLRPSAPVPACAAARP